MKRNSSETLKIHETKLNSIFKTLRYHKPIDRYIILLQHLIDTKDIFNKIKHELKNIEHKFSKIAIAEELTDISNNKKEYDIIPRYSNKKKEFNHLSFDQTNYNNFIFGYQISIATELHSQYKRIKKINSLNNLTYNLNNQRSIINNEIFMVSLMFFNKKSWTYLVEYELTLLPNKEEIVQTKFRFKELLLELKYRLNFDYVPALYDYKYLDRLFEYSSLSLNIVEYINIIDSININSLLTKSTEVYRKKIISEEERKKKILTNAKKAKINLIEKGRKKERKLNEIKKGFTYLLKSINKLTDKEAVKYSEIITNSLFQNNNNKNEKIDKIKSITIPNKMLIDS